LSQFGRCGTAERGANMTGQSAFGSPTPPFVPPPAKPWWKKGWVGVAVIVVAVGAPVVYRVRPSRASGTNSSKASRTKG
jgi:hypothetical protein